MIFIIYYNSVVNVIIITKKKTGLIFLRLDTDEIAVRDRSGLLFFIIINQGFGTMFQTLNVFLEEREIFAKERSAAWYSAGPYFLSKSLAELPMTFTPIILGCIVYFIANLNPSAEAFGFFLLVIYLTTFVTESLGLGLLRNKKKNWQNFFICYLFFYINKKKICKNNQMNFSNWCSCHQCCNG